MKHLAAAFIILIAVTAGSFLCINHTGKVTEHMRDAINSCETEVNAGNWQAAKINISDITSFWNKNRRILAVYLQHNALNDVNDLLTKIQAIVSEQNDMLFKIESKRLLALAEDIRNMDTLTFENLF